MMKASCYREIVGVLFGQMFWKHQIYSQAPGASSDSIMWYVDTYCFPFVLICIGTHMDTNTCTTHLHTHTHTPRERDLSSVFLMCVHTLSFLCVLGNSNACSPCSRWSKYWLPLQDRHYVVTS